MVHATFAGTSCRQRRQHYQAVVRRCVKLCFTVMGQACWRRRGGPTCDSACSWRLASAASLEHQATGTITCYPTQSYYPDTERTSPCPIFILSSDRVGNDKYHLKLIGLTQPGFENTRSRFEAATLRFPDLRQREASALTHSVTPTGLPLLKRLMGERLGKLSGWCLQQV